MVSFVSGSNPSSLSTFCLPKRFTALFRGKIADGTLNPADLTTRTSAERRQIFSDLFGDDNGKEVNALFESKLLLRNQNKGLLDWVHQMSGLKPDVKLDAADRIIKLDRVLNPADRQTFLQDLARKKLGADISVDQAKEIFDRAKTVSDLKTKWLKDVDNMANRTAYGRAIQDLVDLTNSMKPSTRTFKDWAMDVWSIPQSAETGFLHLSAPGVQGWGMMTEPAFYRGVVEMLRYFANEDNYKDFKAYMITHPYYNTIKSSYLGLTDLGDNLNTREEAILSSLVGKANKLLADKTGLPINIFGASNRGFTGYLTYVRFNAMVRHLEAGKMLGEDVQPGSQYVIDLAKTINDASGRSNLGAKDQYKNFGPILNIGAFAVRKVVSDVEMTLGAWRIFDPRVARSTRIIRAKHLVGSLAITAAGLGFAQALGAKVSWNPLDQHFGQAGIPIGDNEYAYLSVGPAWVPRLVARTLWGVMRTNQGKEIDLNQTGYGTPTQGSIILQEIRNKLSPLAGVLTDAAFHKDAIGNEFNLETEVRHRMTPIVFDSLMGIYDHYPEDTAAILPSLSAFLGVRVQTPVPPQTKSNLTAYGDPLSDFHDPVRTAMDKEYFRLNGKFLGFPPETLPPGVRMSPEQYHEYAQNAGIFTKELMNADMQDPDWGSIDDAGRKERFNQSVKDARQSASDALMLKYPALLQAIQDKEDEKMDQEGQ